MKRAFATATATATAWMIVLAARAAADITVIDIDDKSYRARTVEFVREKEKLFVKFREVEGREHLKPAEDIVEIRFKGLELPGAPKPGDVRFVFTNGDHVSGEARGPGKKPETLALATRHLGTIEVSLLHGSRIEVLANRHLIPADAKSEAGLDILVTTKNNRPRGTLETLKPDAATYSDLDDDTQKYTLPMADLAGVYLALRTPPEDPKGLFAIVTLADGGTLRGRIDRIDQGTLVFENAYGRTLTMTLDSIAAVHFRNGRVVYLSDQGCRADENANYIRGLSPSPSDLSFPYQRDLSVKRTKLSLRGSSYTKGLGVHSKSALTYALDGQFSKFRATIGVDDVAGGLGNVVFEVHVDGKKVFDSGKATGEDEPRDLEIDVAKGKELTLVVQFGEEGNTGDCADWAMARLIR